MAATTTTKTKTAKTKTSKAAKTKPADEAAVHVRDRADDFINATSPEDILVTGTHLVAALRAAEHAVRMVRQQAVHDLRAAGNTWQMIVDTPDLDLTRPRLIQILQGQTGGNGVRRSIGEA